MTGDLLPLHQTRIDDSAISPEVARQRGYRSVTEKSQLKRLDFSPTQRRVPALLIPIRDVSGEVVTHQIRPDEPRSTKGKAIKYETPAGSRLVIDVPLSCQPKMGDPEIDLWITEGGRKADAAASAGLCCISLLGVYGWRGRNEDGGKTVLPDWESIALNGRRVYIAFDSDVTTKREVQDVLERLTLFLQSKGAEVHIVCFSSAPDGAKVGLDDYLAQGNTVESLVRLAVKADEPIWDAEREAPTEPPAIAYEPDILERFAREVAATGVAGEVRVIKLIFLVAASRLLDRIVSLTVRGPSAGGKSYLVARVLEYFPPAAYHALTAMSERALIYDEAPLSHRMLVIYEADGIAGQFQSYVIRSLLSEGRLRYQTTEKTKDGFRARTIEREGPTGLIMTTTATRLHAENETRLLTVVVSDTPEQTRSILLALATDIGDDADVGQWHAFQRWLEDGPLDVEIPYAVTLAKAVPPVAVRLRRDFSTVLSLIKAHALLHQATREVEDGVVLATFEDYGAVRQLVADLVADAVDQTVLPTVRETVGAVVELTFGGGEATMGQVASRLGLDKSSASRRVHKAIDLGYLENREERRGKQLRLAVGDPMPSDVSLLPTVEELVRLHGCSAAEGDTHGAPESGARKPDLGTPPEPDATVQPPTGMSSPGVAPGEQPTLCRDCHGQHAAGADCDDPTDSRDESDLTAVALTIFGDMLEGSA